jgi:hypothetical protein
MQFAWKDALCSYRHTVTNKKMHKIHYKFQLYLYYRVFIFLINNQEIPKLLTFCPIHFSNAAKLLKSLSYATSEFLGLTTRSAKNVCIRLLDSDHVIACMDKLTQSNFYLLTELVVTWQLTLAGKGI